MLCMKDLQAYEYEPTLSTHRVASKPQCCSEARYKGSVRNATYKIQNKASRIRLSVQKFAADTE